MNTKLLLPVLLLSAAVISPASANWFSNPSLGINRNVGSAPNPTPAQVRQEKQPPFVLRDQDGKAVAEAAKQAPPAARQAPQSGAQSVATAPPKR
jgi:hypothetical protein